MEEKEIKKGMLWRFRRQVSIAVLLGIGLSAGPITHLAIPKIKRFLKTTPMNETLKKEKLEEYKQLFLKDKNLRLVFSEQELSERLKKNISSVSMTAYMDETHFGEYDLQNNNILISYSAEEEKLTEHVLFHEVTHGIFTRSETETGFTKGVVGNALNEGATEYITRKLIEDTDYKTYKPYENNVEVILSLCIIYGEDVIFNALKEGPHKLAEILEKDGVSYNELNGIMDEFLKEMRELDKIASKENIGQDKVLEHEDTKSRYKTCAIILLRAKEITNKLLLHKYNKANLKEKLEIADRIKQIQYEQYPDKRSIADTSSNEPVNPALRKNISPHVFMSPNDLLDDVYKLYISDKKIDSSKFLSEDDMKAINVGLQTAFLSNNNITSKDLSSLDLQAVKGENGKELVYIIRNKEKIVNIMLVSEQRGNKEIFSFPKSNLETTLTGANKNTKDKISGLVKLHNADESSHYIYHYNDMGYSDLNEIIMMLNNNDGTNAFMCNTKTGECSNLSVEEVCNFGEVIKDKQQYKQPTIWVKAKDKLMQTLGFSEKVLKLGVGQASNYKEDLDYIAENYGLKGITVDNPIQPPIPESDIITADNAAVPREFQNKKDFVKRLKVNTEQNIQPPIPESDIIKNDNTAAPKGLEVKNDFER